MELHLASILEAISDEIGDETALRHGARSRTWAELDDRAARLSAALAGVGLRPGGVVAIDLYNCPELIEVFLAAIKAGFVPTMVNYRYRADELRQLLADSAAEVVVAHPELAGPVRAISADLPDLRAVIELGEDYEHRIDGQRPAPRRPRHGEGVMLSYTGGTTGQPKGVVYGIPNLTGQALRTRWLIAEVDPDAPAVDAVRRLGRRGELPVVCPASPLMHSTAFSFVTLPALCAGGAVVTLENRRFDADTLIDAVDAHRATATAMVGDAFARPLVAALDDRVAAGRPVGAASLRILCSAGVAFSSDTKRRLIEHLPQLTIIDACGSTEGAHYGTSVVRAGDDPTTASFQPVEGTLVVDERRRPVPDGQIGLISALRVTSGYHNQPGETEKRFYVDEAGAARVIPGDLGRIEADGSLTLLGRGSSVINTGGEKVHPEEVEDVIKTMPGVTDAVAWAVPDGRLGSVVGAVVSAVGAGLDGEAVTRYVRSRLAGYKAPRRVVLVEAVPRHANGKIDAAGILAVLERGR